MGMLEYTPILICLMIIALYIVIVKQEKARRDLKALDMKIANSFESLKELVNNQNLEIYDKLKIVSAGIADSTKIDDRNFGTLHSLIDRKFNDTEKMFIVVTNDTNKIINNTKIIDNAISAFELNVKDFSEWQKDNYNELFSKLKNIKLNDVTAIIKTCNSIINLVSANHTESVDNLNNVKDVILNNIALIENKENAVEVTEVLNVSSRTPARKRSRLGK